MNKKITIVAVYHRNNISRRSESKHKYIKVRMITHFKECNHWHIAELI